ncbi:phospholipase D-like domain-containing protein [Pseudoroseomonas globiformis]|uniref:Phospholipase D n=1 Tax=Teichococcus globiformis TaxID=2307229 RepID=A0ABV7G1F8_9PROT
MPNLAPAAEVAAPTAPLLTPGETCWATARAGRFRVMVDAADYFAAARSAMLKARHSILMIGWDFDTRIKLEPGGTDHPGPPKLGRFLNWLARERPELRIRILKWDLGLLGSLARGETPFFLLDWMTGRRVRLKLDGAHPAAAAHHMKLMVIDDALAFCGGIDMTVGRWDTRGHEPDAKHRRTPGGSPCDPWHDATTCVDGAAAAKLAELARERWRRATSETLEPVTPAGDPWPDDLPVDLRDVEIGIARTIAEYDGHRQVAEIETLTFRAIAAARRHLYIESQYFASRRVAEAMVRRLAEPDGPEIVVINPESADGWLEQKTMDAARVRLLHLVRRADRYGRFRIFHPVNTAGTPIYVHAKIMVVDDRLLKIGSANMNNRSLGYDTECDLAVEGTTEAIRRAIVARRDDLLAEHLGCEAADVATALDGADGSLIRAIEALNTGSRRLVPLESRPLGPEEEALAETDLVDPERPTSLWRQLRSVARV